MNVLFKKNKEVSLTLHYCDHTTLIPQDNIQKNVTVTANTHENAFRKILGIINNTSKKINPRTLTFMWDEQKFTINYCDDGSWKYTPYWYWNREMENTVLYEDGRNNPYQKCRLPKELTQLLEMTGFKISAKSRE